MLRLLHCPIVPLLTIEQSNNEAINILDLLFPKTCLSCNKFGKYICPLCEKKLEPVLKQRCPYCKKGSYLGLTHQICKRTYGVDGHVSIYRYSPELQKIIKGIKYRRIRNGMQELMKIAAFNIVQNIKTHMAITNNMTIIPVPLHSNRKKTRGFNQSKIIASDISKTLNTKYDTKLIFRSKDTSPQAQLKIHKERYHNIKGAFSINKEIDIPKNIFIVDDVWTSGSTIKEMTRLLKKTGAIKVYALTLA